MAQHPFGILRLADIGRHRFVVQAVIIGLALLLAAPCAAGKAKKRAPRKAPAAKTRHLTAEQKTIPDAVAFKPELEKFIGIPYRRGGAGPSGMDCSGFAKTFFSEAFGIDLPHNSKAISRLDFLEGLPADRHEYRPGDLLFFNSGKGKINHVGIYLGEGKFIHASRHSGVVVANLDHSYWKRRLVASKRVTMLDDAQLTDPGDTPETAFAATVPQSLALGYVQPLFDDRLNLGLERLYGGQDPLVPEGPTPFHVSCGTADAGPSAERYQGWRARLDFTPSPWLHITPSLASVDVISDALGGSNGALRTYGLSTRIAADAHDWSLSMAAQTSHFEEYADPLQDRATTWRSLDLSFDVGYRLAEGFNLSVSGSHSGLFEGNAGAAPRDLPANLSDVRLRFKIEF